MEDVIMLDTGVLIDFLGDRDRAEEAETIIASGKAAVSSISVYELFRGVEGKKHLVQRNSLLAYLHVIDLTAQIAGKAGKLYTQLKKKGRLVHNEDILIGASCIYHHIPLFTGNRKHFEDMLGLQLYTF